MVGSQHASQTGLEQETHRALVRVSHSQQGRGEGRLSFPISNLPPGFPDTRTVPNAASFVNPAHSASI
jgi:hypothetical protein